jgi:hypothetical protein
LAVDLEAGILKSCPCRDVGIVVEEILTDGWELPAAGFIDGVVPVPSIQGRVGDEGP